MGCHHEISNGRGVTTVVNAGGLAGGCSFCKSDALERENKRLAEQNDRYETALREIASVVADQDDLLSIIWFCRDTAIDAVGILPGPRPPRAIKKEK